MNSWFKPLKTDSRKRSLMALLGGVAAIGIAKSVSAQTPAVPLGASGGLNTGGGGGSSAMVASLSALVALVPTPGASVLLTQSWLFGQFNWTTGTFSTQVTNDPGQGVYIAPGSDTTGASGAWVRQYSGAVNLAWFGLVSGAFNDAPTIAANSAALTNFAIWARYQSSLGFGVDVVVSEGFYPWDQFITKHWVGGIQLLHITGYGATFQNVTTNASWLYTFPLDWPGFLQASDRFLINSTVVGALAFTTITATDVANLVVGDYVMLTSLDIQYFGYPPNASQFEYSVITAINQYSSASPTAITYTTSTGLLAMTFATAPLGAAVGSTLNGAAVTVSGMTATGGTPPNGTWPIVSTASAGTVITLQTPSGLGTLVISGGTLAAVGAVTLDRPIRWQHLSTYPDNPSNLNPAGAARVWLLKNNGGVSGAPLWDWNVKHVYEGLSVLEAMGQTNGQGYITMAGKYIEWRNATIPGISPSVTQTAKLVGCKFYLPGGSQPDKLIDTCILEDNEIQGSIAFTGATNTLIARGNVIGGSFTAGAKSNILDSNAIGTFFWGASNGVSCSVIINGGRVNNYTPADHFGSGSQAFTVGSGGITYANGLFTLPWTALTVLLPGMMMHFGTTGGGLYAGDLGSMMVTSISGDSTNFYAQTTCQLPSVPAWASGQVFVRRQQRLLANGVSGCDQIRRASAATKAGFQEWEYIEEQLIGTTSAAGHAKAVGFPVEFSINVRQPCAVASKTLTISMLLYQSSAPTTTETMTWVIDLTAIGKRVLNQTGSVVLFGADTLTFNGAAAAAFPAGWFLNGNAWPAWSLNYAPSALTSLQLPWVEMKVQFDPGMYFTVPTAQLDQAVLDTLIGQMGSLL